MAGITQTIGVVGFVGKGNWNSSATYNQLNVVYYNGSSYVARVDVPANITPGTSSASYWQKLLDGSFIQSVTTGEVTQEDGYTVTNVIVNTLDDSETFEVRAKNGVTITSISAGTAQQQNGFTVTPITVNLSDGTNQQFNISSQNGISITSVSAGQPYVSGDSTITPITVGKSDGDSDRFNVAAQNGADGATIETITSATETSGDDYTTTTVTVKMTDDRELEFDVQSKNGTEITEITSGSAQQENGYTVTPITVQKSDGSSDSFDVYAFNPIVNQYHYTARWDKSLAQLTRMGSAAGITTNTENFGYFGSVNASYENPFDNIYPWSGIRLCNIDLEKYQYLTSDQSLTDCVVAWEGDGSFSYEHQNGVWRYRPEFWGKSWDDGTYRYFDVTDKPVGGYVHYPESIGGRWHGRAVSKTVNGELTTCLLPTTGIPAVRTPLSTLHTYAKNYGATLDSIYSIDADTLLFVVEYATMNSQSAIGNGVSNLYRQSSDQISEAATNSTVVKVLASAGTDYCIPGAIFDIGTTNGGNEVGSYYVVSAEADSDPTYLDVTLNAAVTVTRDNYWSVHGLINQADASIGSKSGYIGTNGKCNAYYRGMVLYGNMSFYTLGVYQNHDNQHIWIATSDEQADEYDALDTSAHLDTGLVLPTTGGFIQTLGMLSYSGSLSIPPFCTAIGGTSTNPVGDGTANIESNNNTVLGFGGGANLSLNCGTLYTRFDITQLSASTAMSARSRLKPPRIRVVGTTLIL